MNTQPETNLYITVVPGNRIELDFLCNPTAVVLYELEALIKRYSGIELYSLSDTRHLLVGSEVHEFEQLARQIKSRFEAFDFSFTVRGQIDLIRHSKEL